VREDRLGCGSISLGGLTDAIGAISAQSPQGPTAGLLGFINKVINKT